MKNIVCGLLMMVFFLGCKQPDTEWNPLIINNSLEGWHIFQDDGSKKGWIVENGVLIFNGISDMESGEGDASLLSDKIYESFEIKFDWKIESGGNSGFMWGVQEDKKYKYPYQTGPEVQILDHAIYEAPETVLGGEIELQNVLEDLEEHRHDLGALYDLSPPSILDAGKPAGEWNTYHIKIDHNNNLGEVVLNGTFINSFPLNGPKWEAMVAESKFANSEAEEAEYLGPARWYDFGKFSKGHICLQDHPGRVAFKNIMIRELH